MKRFVILASVTLTLGSCIGSIGGEGEDRATPPAEGPTYDSEVEAGDDGRALTFYYGPMKLMLAESILHSIATITGHEFGQFDFLTPDPGTQAFVDAGNADDEFYRHCRLFGGCMEHRIPLERTSFVGTGYVLQLEKAVTEACSDRQAFGMFPSGAPPEPTTQVIDVIEHQYRLAFSAAPEPEEIERSLAYFDGHIADPELEDVSPLESAGRGHCRALLTTNRFLFY